jgi:tRNA modification GTPase
MNLSQNIGGCIVAISTPNGAGAIAVVRLSGFNSLEIVSSVFSKNLKKVASHTIHYGYIKDGNIIVDEVMVSVFKAPKSFTTEDSVEITCHGSIFIQQQILQLLIRRGARLAQPGEFTMRAFLNGRIDLTQAEAVADLIASESAAAHDLAIKQMRGGFAAEINLLREELIGFAALIELENDFGEEDVEFANRKELKTLVHKILRFLESLIRSFQLGNVIKNGVATVIAGRPNAGKSTLLNALLNEDRAIVSEIAGTTRDTIEEALNINGIVFKLIDTAGIREAQDAIETIGVEKTMEKIKTSALLLYVFDAAELDTATVEQDIATIQAKNTATKVMVIANKTDQLDISSKNAFPEHYVLISAKENAGIDAVKDALYNRVIDHPEQLSAPIVTNVRHYDALEQTRISLQAVLNGLESGISSDFVAMDIRHALSYLGSITGTISSDDLLDNIFSNFCIGK